MGGIPRLRIFAGPNGSGKSTLKDELNADWLGTYINADEIQQAIVSTGYNISKLPFTLSQDDVSGFWNISGVLPDSEKSNVPMVVDGRIWLDFPQASYGAAAIADLLRRKLLQERVTFSFESVMSHQSKIDLLVEAQAAGYRTYLYFICTADPAINVARVAARVSAGGHPVPEDKIRERYYRTLKMLPAAIQACNRAYIFDNSQENQDKVWIAEFTDGTTATFKVDMKDLPTWFLDSAGSLLRPRSNS